MTTQTVINWQELSKHINVQTLLVEIMAGGFRYLLDREGGTDMHDHTVQYASLVAADTTLTLPLSEIPDGRIGDFCVWVENDYEESGEGAEAAISLDGWGESFDLATFDGDSVASALTFAADEKAVLTFTLTPLTHEVEVEEGGETVTKTLPVWFVIKRKVKIEPPTAETPAETQEP